MIMSMSMRALALLTGAVVAAVSLANAAGSSAPNNTDRSDTPLSDAATPVLCSATLNAYCPPHSTCCPSAGGYSCLLSWSSRVPQGPCCADDDGASGCAAGYACAAALPDAGLGDDDDLTSGPHCRRDDGAAPVVDTRGRPVDTDFEVTKRYRTCPAFAQEDIAAPHGLPVSTGGDNAGEGEGGDNSDVVGQLAYFTNYGPLASPSHQRIKTAVLGIHGSGRDAGSYLCSLIPALMPTDAPSSRTTAAGRRRRRALEVEQDDLLNKAVKAADRDVLIVAPWFLAPADGTPPTDSTLPFLTWVDEAAVAHSFRYGAESIPAPLHNDGKGERLGATVSSFGAMDALLAVLCNRDQYPELERVVVVGHSAGGQFVHRWGLTSDSACFGDANGSVGGGEQLPSLRLVPANPRSYAYLDGRRYLPIEGAAAAVASFATQAAADEGHESSGVLSPFDELEFRQPNGLELDICRLYNQYCWGLEPNPDLPAPYVTDHINRLLPPPDVDPAEGEGSRDTMAVFARYASRDIVYLSGARDTKPLGDQLCAEDGYQGPTRRERSERFYAALQARGAELAQTCRRQAMSREGDGSARGEDAGTVRHATEFCARREVAGDGEGRVHARLVVKDVGHDHALIFQSSEAYEGMFG